MKFYLNDMVTFKGSSDWVINAYRSDPEMGAAFGLYNSTTGEVATVSLPVTNNEITLVKRSDPIVDFLDDIKDDLDDPSYTALFRFYNRVKRYYKYEG